MVMPFYDFTKLSINIRPHWALLHAECVFYNARTIHYITKGVVFDKFSVLTFLRDKIASKCGISAIPNALCRKFQQIVCLGKQKLCGNFSHIFHCMLGIWNGIYGI
jgi:hypothetical protein